MPNESQRGMSHPRYLRVLRAIDGSAVTIQTIVPVLERAGDPISESGIRARLRNLQRRGMVHCDRRAGFATGARSLRWGLTVSGQTIARGESA